MSASLRQDSPFGRGNSGASRAGRRPLAPGIARATIDWAPLDYQAQLLAAESGVLVAAGALGSGKSEPGALRLIKWALRNPRRADGRPTNWYVIGPDFSLIKQEQFGKILEHARRIRGVNVVKRVITSPEPKIILCHDQVLLGRSSSDPDRFRGHEIDGFWGDEIQKWPEKAFRIAFSRLRSTDAVRVVLTGSPEDSPGWVWRMVSGEGYNKLRRRLIARGSGLWCFRWASTMNSTNDAGVQGSVRDVLDESSSTAARQELDGRFPGTLEAPTQSLLEYVRAFVGSVRLSPAEASAEVLGIDIGETKDFTWFTVLSKKGVVLAQERFNAGSPGVPRNRFFPYLELRILEAIKQWHPKRVVIDTAKSGKPVLMFLEEKLNGSGVVVEGYPTDSPGKKSELLEQLALGLARGVVRIPTSWTGDAASELRVEHVDQLRKEFEELEPQDLPQGKRRWKHPEGGHDDGVVALGLAYHGLAGRPPEGGDFSYLMQTPKVPSGTFTPPAGRFGGSSSGLGLRFGPGRSP